MTKISAVVNTLNEEKNIVECLSSLTFADEIILVDMMSDDRTVELAKNTDKIKTYYYPRVGYVEPARNFGIDKATGDWILIIDADERIPKTLSDKLIEIASSDAADVIKIPRKNIMFNKWMRYGFWWTNYQVRFFKKGFIKWDPDIHSQPEVSGRKMKLPAEERYAIEHYFLKDRKDRREWWMKMQKYADIEAKNMFERKEYTKPLNLFLMPLKEFYERIFEEKAYLDGLIGLELNMYKIIYRYLVHYKLLRLQRKNDVT